MEAGKFNTVIGNLPPNAKLGDGNTIVNAADANGNVILNTPMAVGYGARAGKDSISIGAFAGGGMVSPEINPVPNSATNPTSNDTENPIKREKISLYKIAEKVIGSLFVLGFIWAIAYYFGVHL